MMKFICYTSRSFTTYVKVGGKDVQVCFCNPNANALGKGEVYIHREDLQKAMLESKRYGVDWFSPDVPEVSEESPKESKDVSGNGSAELGVKGSSGTPGISGVMPSELSAEDLKDLQGGVGVVGDLGVNTEKEIVVVKSVPEAKVILKERGFEGTVRLRCDAEKAAESLGFELQFSK